MDFCRAFVKPAPPTIDVTPEEIERVVGFLAGRPAEIEFREDGAFRHGQRLDGCDRVAAVLAARNVRSLLSRVNHLRNIRIALGLTLTGAPEDAEDALEEAGVELNLRLSLFTTDDARLSMDGAILTIEGEQPATQTLERKQYREAGRGVFCTEGLFRLLYSRIECVKYLPSVILPLPRQLIQVAAMDSDTPGLVARRIDWRATRKPHFEKQYCVSCGACFYICLNDAIVRPEGSKVQPGPIERGDVNHERCMACGLCAANCPGDAQGHKAVVMIRAQVEGAPEMHQIS